MLLWSLVILIVLWPLRGRVAGRSALVKGFYWTIVSCLFLQIVFTGLFILWKLFGSAVG